MRRRKQRERKFWGGHINHIAPDDSQKGDERYAQSDCA
jgi:hypothetical protein